ncbi:uncharacterized protein CELE_R05G9.1 [Caenorhabditis elegans]|uniref:Uncharacterized protein n=1 Tax=Caenorhabditis elegans TaxID=6239 RepID=Q966H0_CAEEL|nr:Uncharacterized protein CELE_R05G9.1 [Caenorhabditis elegans]CCD73230.2 Uncharacterized protein CELE_R05G9.1 [Caenorhabditis elegans]|eukprot:NP_495315.2 Uncharacterized protein CELE_R05G9.1 [Caenorhabditis elegans]
MPLKAVPLLGRKLCFCPLKPHPQQVGRLLERCRREKICGGERRIQDCWRQTFGKCGDDYSV